jgi:predicted nucleic acid-binding protein
MARIVIIDAGPLIALAGTDNLDLLRRLFAGVCLPPAVKTECLEKPGIDTDRIATAIEAGWLEVKPAAEISPQLSSSLGAGEQEAIGLALQDPGSSLLIMDDRLARRQALQLRLNIVGTVRLLDLAENRGLTASAEQVIRSMRDKGYRISLDLLSRIRTDT